METVNTREAWLERAVDKFRDGLFREQGAEIPSVRVSVGFPSRSKTAIGQCWRAEAASDKRPQVFVSPIIDDGSRALDVLVHELVHAVLPDAKHGAEFKRLATAVGLEGKMTATTASDRLKIRLNAVVAEIGPYPHAALNPGLSGVKKQGTRLNKAVCDACGYTVRVTRKWLDDVGAPICPCSGEAMTVC